ncbi:MAG TPA: amidase family protein [Acidobacteriota bacterium]|nr:amidase family protein [Acidobacteriota bacterium]
MVGVKEKISRLSSGTLTARQNIQHFLDTISATNKTVNAVLSLNPHALAQADAIDAKRKNGSPMGKLAGLGIIVKSNICVEGLIANCASKTLANYTATYDADVISRIKAEDGIIIGMANQDEFACGISGETSAFGKTQNPAAPGFVPGGSSSGSAAAVAAGYCDIALGSDTGGSIRNPASHCGVVGIKPSYGRVSRYGLIDLSMSLDQIGPLSTDVYGCALMMEVISGYSSNDPTTQDSHASHYTTAANKNIRVATSPDFDKLCSDNRILSLVNSAVAAYKPSTVRLEHIDLAIQTYYPLVYVEFFSGTRKFDGRRYGLKIEESCGDEVLRRILGGREISKAEHAGKYYRTALAVKQKIADELHEAFKHVDVIVLPTTPILPHKFGDKLSVEDSYAYDAYTIPANLAGICAGVVPVGVIGGVPVGMQVFARDEMTLFSFLNEVSHVSKR